MGYEHVRHYVGGLEEWLAAKGPTERGSVMKIPAIAVASSPAPASAPAPAMPPTPAPAPAPAPTQASRVILPAATAPARFAPTSALVRFLDALGERSVPSLIRLWFWMILGFGGIYWLAGIFMGHGILSAGEPIGSDLSGLLTSIYFSFVTALSIGYGDVVPVGAFRALAVAEGAAGLLIFGVVISKLVSRHQEELTAEIHRITFEDRLNRVRANLHLVHAELRSIAAMCANQQVPPAEVNIRTESAASLFLGEMRTVHDLLYRPQQVPEEEVLESILANVAAGCRELGDLLGCLPADYERSHAMTGTLRSMSTLAQEICGHCVPRVYAADLQYWMDQIQHEAERLV
jgi:potassium channel LctB